MSPTPIRPRIPETLNILQHLSPQVVLDLHAVERGVELEDLCLREFTDAGGVVEVEAGHEAGGGEGTDAEEGLEGLFDEAAFGEVDVEDEDLGWVIG